MDLSKLQQKNKMQFEKHRNYGSRNKIHIDKNAQSVIKDCVEGDKIIYQTASTFFT